MKTKAAAEAPQRDHEAAHRAPLALDAAILKDVAVQLQASLGETTLPIEELLALRDGSVVKLDLRVNDLIELRLNNALVARGEIVAVDDHFGVRIVEIAQG